MQKSIEQQFKSPVFVSKWMRHYGIDDNDSFSAGELEEVINNFKDEFIDEVYEAAMESISKLIEEERVQEVILPGQSQERLQMKRWINKKLDRILQALAKQEYFKEV